ncbi:MAG: proton-conducting transporter membrane subunit, partial [Lawsonibacter sp.]
AYVLGFFGFGVKAAVVPGHKWLLRASVAPTPVTALLHAVAVVKAGVFAVIRLTWYGFGPELLRDTWAQTAVMAAAIVTIVFGSAKALQTKHLKRRLAWSTISNLSYVLLGVTTLTTAGLVAGLAHMVFHGVLKITLFFGVGAVHFKLHRDFVPDIEGCGALMPAVFATFTTAALGLMGVPPLAGFSSKWLLATSCAALNTTLGYLGTAALIVSAVLTILYLMQIVMLAYFPRQNRAISVKIPKRARRDPGPCMIVPLAVLAATSVALGLGAGWVVRTISGLVVG